MSEITIVQAAPTVIDVTEAAEPTVIQMGVLQVVKIDDDFLAYIAQAQAAQTGAEAAQGLAEDALAGIGTSLQDAETARDDAQTAQGLAETARDKARDWAEELEDVEVETGQYSALHHATKASASSGAADSAKTDAEAARDAAQTAQGLAETARDKAQDWAEAVAEVEPDAYSAKHWAEEAQGLAEAVGTHDVDADAHANMTPRVPAGHAASHATGQTDAIAPGDIGAATDDHNHDTLIIYSETEPASGVFWFDGENLYYNEAE